MALVSDIKTIITSTSANIYYGEKPDNPNNIVSIFETGGQSPVMSMDHAYRRQSFQIYIRNTSHDKGLDVCESIITLLNTLSNTTINSTFYLMIRQRTDIIYIGKDKCGRFEFTINFETLRN